MATVRSSNGQIEGRQIKDKVTDMQEEELYQYVLQLLRQQNGICKLTGLRMIMDKEGGDSALRASPDRIDSDLGYLRGNIQIVCQFANAWKGSAPNEEFLRLLAMIRGDALRAPVACSH